MKLFLQLLSVLFLLSSCSKDDPNDLYGYKVESVFPLKARIGDTLTIYGSNLTKIKTASFMHTTEGLGSYNYKVKPYNFFLKTDDSVQIIIPELKEEDIILKIPGTENIDFKIVGFIPLLSNFQDIQQIQVIDENMAFLSDGKSIYISTDGFYTWDRLYSSGNSMGISRFYYMNENNFWIGIMEDYRTSLHYSNNLIPEFTEKFTMPGEYLGKIKFVTPEMGFIKDNKNFYVSDNNSFVKLYDYYPQLNELPFGEIVFYDFNAVNENLIFLIPNAANYLIKIEHNDVSYTEIEFSPSFVQLFDETGYLTLNDEIHKTEDRGGSWRLLKRFDGYMPSYSFADKNTGYAILSYTPSVALKTLDGGETWEKIYTFKRNESAQMMGVTTANALFAKYDGKMWKYVAE